MKETRRHILKQASLSAVGAGFLSRVDRVTAMQGGASTAPLIQTLSAQATGASEKLLLKGTPGEEGPPQPATADRLPLEWNKRTVQRFKDAVAQRGAQAFLVRNPLNIMYITGYWHTVTERPQAVFMNRDQADPWYFYPSLDRGSVTSWWFGGGLKYFDVQDIEGVFPEDGVVRTGPTTDLFKLMLGGIKKHGIQGTKIALDGELYPSESEKAKEVLPGVEFVNANDILLDMRMVKTPEELALWRRAYTYFDRAHAFARDYILTHGTSVTDYEVAMATTLWINDILYRDIKLENGALHHGVHTSMSVTARVGPLTAYPHPNQPQFNQIARNKAMQVEGVCRIGGYGGENYRMFVIADEAGKFDAHMQKLWEVSQHCCDMQVELSKAGNQCSDVALPIHKYQVELGVQKYVYHRPGHGEGSEGHQPPYIALGDHTVLKAGMCFSEEPGLFDPDTGCGFNWSDTVVVAQKSGYRMSRVPYSKEWCFIRI
jgi:Xaa-Pro aminopeptidase